MNTVDIHDLYKNNYIDLPDWIFAKTILRLAECNDPWVAVAAAFVHHCAANGDVCLNLSDVVSQVLESGRSQPDIEIPLDTDEWRLHLRKCPAVGEPGDFSPLILAGDRLYLHRYWTYEHYLACRILQRCDDDNITYDTTHLDQLLQRLFAQQHTAQYEAARSVATQRLTVISGGPGTGKTYTIAKSLILLHWLSAETEQQIALAAPTGKAAARLQEAIESISGQLSDQTDSIFPQLPKAVTLHRLLGYVPTHATFRYHAGNLLPVDGVIVDEASMIDLGMMHHLVQALPQHARLVLVGDKDQLASVEAGAVLGDICYGVQGGYRKIKRFTTPKAISAKLGEDCRQTALFRHIVVLDHSYRFDSHSGIGALCQAINQGHAEQVLALLASAQYPHIELKTLTDPLQWESALQSEVHKNIGPIFDRQTPADIFDILNRFKILTAVRKGPYGLERMNAVVEKVLRKHGLIASEKIFSTQWYPGRPVMITHNDYFHNLFNGDIGIATRHTADGRSQMAVMFPSPDGQFRYFAPHQLPHHETVYAMTIHKSQGSEFDRVVVILPDRQIPIVTRELIYTAVTRARKSITIWADPQILSQAVAKTLRRSSGLRDALWG